MSGLTEWANFFITCGTAAATLTGLIFVGVSISLQRILSIPKLAGRAFESLVLLINILFVSVLCLVPGQSVNAIGLEIGGLGLVVWAVVLYIDIGILRQKLPQYRWHHIRNLVFSQLSMLPFLVAAIGILTGDINGLYWVIPGIIFSFIKALVDAWVMLVEIHR